MFDQKVDLVTGAGSGMGAGDGRGVHEGGATVAVLDMNADTAHETLEGLGGEGMAVVADVRNRAAITQAVAGVLPDATAASRCCATTPASSMDMPMR
jgi:NAD(P)-dependent dehydrogenase (short-subunit alcohol dehydrogenase family)